MAETKKPTENERAAAPNYYWWHGYNGPVEFYWDDWEVTEDEYRRNAPRHGVGFLDEVMEDLGKTNREH
jgi:hypothetical protein